MPPARTLPIPAEHREFTVKVGGQAVARAHQLLSVSVIKAANKISAARLAYADGAAAAGDFPLSNADTFVPGADVEILAGAGGNPVSLFKGLVIRQHLKVRDQAAPQLIVECRHAAVKLTVGRKSAYFLDQADSDIMLALLDQAGVDADVEVTPVLHKQQVQYACTDWDFLRMRAEANGRLVFTNDGQVTIKAPTLSGAPVCTLQFGATLLELDTEIDARRQYRAVKAFSWDAAQQSVLDKEAATPGTRGPGNLEPNDLADVVGLDHWALQNAASTEAEAQAWADAEWLRSRMCKVSGRVKCEGIATVNPGDIVTLAGVGDRCNGDVYVTGVRHDFDLVQGWKTHLQFGGIEQRLADGGRVTAPPASALVPGVNGLQIGVVVGNEDPEGEHRVQVRMPLVDANADGSWARVAMLDAGNERGFFFRPEIGDEVVLGFLNDDPRQPVILGMLHSSAKPAPLTGSDDNHEKVYQSRSKLKLYFNDDQKIVQLETPAGNKISLNEADQGIKIEDQNGNRIELTPEGIKIESAKAIELKAGTELKMSAATELGIKGGAGLKLEGTASAELSSSGITKVKGSLVQIN